MQITMEVRLLTDNDNTVINNYARGYLRNQSLECPLVANFQLQSDGQRVNCFICGHPLSTGSKQEAFSMLAISQIVYNFSRIKRCFSARPYTSIQQG